MADPAPPSPRGTEAFLRPGEQESLQGRERCLCAVLAAVTVGDTELLREVFALSVELGCERGDLVEILLQGHLFAGFPRTLEAFELLERELGTAAWSEPIEPHAGRDHAAPAEPRGSGPELFRQIYAELSDAIQDQLRRYHPELARWILEHAYGTVLSRPQLPARIRELAAVTALIASRSWRQLASHLRGAYRCGASIGEISEAIEVARLLSDRDGIDRAHGIALSLTR